MIPATTNLDFYTVPPSHRAQAKQRLHEQRKDMFSWRHDAAGTTFHPVTGERVRPAERLCTEQQQVLLKDSARAAAAAEATRRQHDSTWASASSTSVLAPDRRREWRLTGFTFDRSHFRSTRGGAATAPASTAHGAREPYVPYYHDSIVLCKPRGAAARASSQTILAVTSNRAEAAAGPAADHRSSAQLAEDMYSGLVSRQAALTGTEVGSAASLDLRLHTCELAYEPRHGPAAERTEHDRSLVSLHPSLQQDDEVGLHAVSGGSANVTALSNAHRSGAPHSQSGSGCTSPRTSSAGSSHTAVHPDTLSSGSPMEGCLAGRNMLPLHDADDDASPHSHSRGAAAPESSPYPPYVTDRSRGSAAASLVRTQPNSVHNGPAAHSLPAEAKATRLYAVQLQQTVTDQTTSMVQRQEPLRRGVPVILPEQWRSPLSN